MGLFDKIKGFFAFTFNDKQSGSSPVGDNPQTVKVESTANDPGRVTMASDVQMEQLENPDLQTIFDGESVKKIPRDQNVTPVSVMAGLVLNGTEDAIDGYNLVKVHDDGSTDVNVVGGTISISNVNIGKSDDDDGTIVAGQSSIMLTLPLNYAYNGASWERLKSSSGRLLVDGSQVTQPVSGTFFQATQPISAVSLPLPTGASTEATLSGIKTDTDKFTFTSTRLLVDGSGVTQPVSGTVTANIGTTNGLALDATLTGGTQKTRILDTSGNGITSQASGAQRALDVGIDVAGVQIDPRQIRALTSADVVTSNQGGTWNINNISGTISLPTGAATEATLSSIKTDADRLDVNLSTRASETTVAGIKTQTDKLTFTATRLLVDGSGVTQPVSGTVTANIGTTNGLMLDATFTGRINTQGQKTMAASTPVVIASDQSAIPSSQSGTWNINNISGTISLPTGASTSAKQDTGNTSLASIDGKLNSLGQKAMAASVPVVISSDQSTVNTDPQDRVARELGRVLASDALYVSETFSLTSNVFANARPVNGDMNVRHYKTKKVYIKNTSANQGHYTILGSVDNGTNFDVTIAADTTINTGVTSITDLTDAVTHIQIQVRSNNGAQTTTYVTKAYALGV